MLYVIHLRGTGSSETRLAAILQAGLSGTVYEEINDPDVFLLRAADLQGQACLFAISLGRGGANDAYHRLITLLYTHTDFLAGVCAGLVIDGPDELFTKKNGQRTALHGQSGRLSLSGQASCRSDGLLI